MKILYQGKVPNSRRRHVGIYIASGPGQHKVLFRPGVNQVAVEDFEGLLDDDGKCASSALQARFDSGDLKIIEDDRPPSRRQKTQDPFEGSPVEALELVESTIDVVVLRDWLLREQSKPAATRRDNVIGVLHKQIDVCTKRPDGTPAEPRKIELHARNAPDPEPEVTPAPSPDPAPRGRGGTRPKPGDNRE